MASDNPFFDEELAQRIRDLIASRAAVQARPTLTPRTRRSRSQTTASTNTLQGDVVDLTQGSDADNPFAQYDVLQTVEDTEEQFVEHDASTIDSGRATSEAEKRDEEKTKESIDPSRAEPLPFTSNPSKMFFPQSSGELSYEPTEKTLRGITLQRQSLSIVRVREQWDGMVQPPPGQALHFTTRELALTWARHFVDEKKTSLGITPYQEQRNAYEPHVEEFGLTVEYWGSEVEWQGDDSSSRATVKKTWAIDIFPMVIWGEGFRARQLDM